MTEKRIPKKIIYLNVTGFFLKFATTVSLILSCTSFLKTAGAEKLPLYYIILNILSISAGTTLAVKNIRDFRFPVYLSSVIGVYLIWFSSVMDSAASAGVIVLYTLTSIYDIYANILFWTHINQCLTIKEMKSYVGLISGVSFFGGILAGLFTKLLLGYISMKSAFIMCGAAHLLLPLVTLLHVESPQERESFFRAGFADMAMRQISGSRLLKIIMLIFVFSSFVRYIVGFQYGTAVAARFTDEKSLAGFIGLFDSAVKISIFISQILAAKKLLKNFSLSANLLFYQSGIIGLSLILFFMKSFWVMIAFQFYFQLFVKLIEQNVANTLFNVFARDIKNQMKFMVEGMVFPLTSIFVGIFIACFKNSIEPRYFFLFLFITGICYYISTLKLNEAYMDTIADGLRNGAAGGAEKAVRKMPMDGSFDIEYYLASERAGRLDMVFELEKLSPVISSGIILKLLRGEKDKFIMASIVKTACRQKSDEVRTELWRTVSDMNDNRVTANFIEASAMQGDSRLIPYIAPYLQHPDNRVRANAILAAVKLCGEESSLRLAVESLYKMSSSADSGCRVSAAAVMGELGLECFAGALEKLLFDGDFKVRKSAVSACEKNGSQKLISALERMKALAENEKISFLASRAISRIENGVFAKISMVLNAYPNDEKRKISALLKNAGDNRSVDILIKILNASPDGFSLKFAEIFSGSSRGNELLKLAEDYIRDKKFPVRSFLNAVIFEEKNYECGDELLKAVSLFHRSSFEEEFSAAVRGAAASGGNAFARSCFSVLGVYLNDMERAMAIFENAGSKDPVRADMALELLESIEYEPLKSCFIEMCRNLKG